MHVNGVLNLSDPLLQSLFEQLRVVVGKLFLVVADGVHHGTEQLELLVGSYIESSKIPN